MHTVATNGQTNKHSVILTITGWLLHDLL